MDKAELDALKARIKAGPRHEGQCPEVRESYYGPCECADAEQWRDEVVAGALRLLDEAHDLKIEVGRLRGLLGRAKAYVQLWHGRNPEATPDARQLLEDIGGGFTIRQVPTSFTVKLTDLDR